MQLSVRDGGGHAFGQARLFTYVRAAFVDSVHDIRQDIAADDVHAVPGELDGDGQPDFAQADHGNRRGG